MDSVSLQGAPGKEAICAVVVTYFPEGDLTARLLAVRAQVGRVVVVDNGTTGPAADILGAAESALDVEVIRNACNSGIAAALNQGVRWAQERDFSWVLTLDQDSIVFPDMVESQAQALQACGFSEKVAVIGSNFTHAVDGRVFGEVGENSSLLFSEVEAVITSGSLVSLSVFEEIGDFREEFFLDCVDFDYCLRARSNGFRVIMTTRVLMEHPIGHVSRHRLAWVDAGTANYTPIRQYYMTRNTIILAKEYVFKAPLWVCRSLWVRTKSIILVCVFESGLLPKIRFLLLGVFDGILGRMGRFAA